MRKAKPSKGGTRAKGKKEALTRAREIDRDKGISEVPSKGTDEGPMDEGEEEEPLDVGPIFNPTPFQFLLKEEPESYYEASDFILNRPFRASLNYLQNPHGSVKLYQGDTCTLCAVYGPAEVRNSKELPHRAAVDVLFRPKITGISSVNQATGWDGTLDERAVEAKLVSILEPVIFLEDDMGCGFNVILHEVEDDGCLFSACVNAAALALINAGCAMRCTFAAVTILVDEKSGLLIVDPSQSQISNGFDALLTYVVSSHGHILYTDVRGKTTTKMIRLGIRQAYESCKEILKFQKQIQMAECSDFLKNQDKKVSLVVKDENEVDVKMEEMKIENEDDEDYVDVSDDEEGQVVSDSGEDS